MTLLASNLGMQTRQRILRLGVVEMGNIFPVHKVMALLAAGSKASIVCVLVTRGAGLRQPQKGAAAVANLNAEALGGRDTVGSVALVAGQSRVLPL